MHDHSESVLRGGSAFWDTVRPRNAEDEPHAFSREMINGRSYPKFPVIEVQDYELGPLKVFLAADAVCPDERGPPFWPADDLCKILEVLNIYGIDIKVSVVGVREGTRYGDEHGDWPLH